MLSITFLFLLEFNPVYDPLLWLARLTGWIFFSVIVLVSSAQRNLEHFSLI